MHGTDESDGTPFNVGAELSTRVTVCVALPTLPQVSVAVHTRVNKRECVAVLHVASWCREEIEAERLSSQLSVTLPPSVATVSVFDVHETEVDEGAVTVGAVLSVTITDCSPVPTLPQSSVADHTRLTTTRIYP